MHRRSEVVVAGMVVTLLAIAACTGDGASERPGTASPTAEPTSAPASPSEAGEPSGSDAAVDWPAADTALVLPDASELGRFDGEVIAPFGATAGLAAEDDPRQTIAGDSDGRWVVWAETDSTAVAATRWRVFAQDTASHASRARLIARSEDVLDGGLPPSWNDAEPVIGGDRAYWHTAVPAEGTADGYSVRVVSTALDGSEALRIEAEAAVHPAPTGRGLAVLTDRDTAAGRAMGLALVPEPGRIEPLLALPADSEEGLSGLVGDGHRVAFAGWRTVYAVDLDTREVWAVPLPENAPRYVELSLCGDLLHWSVGQSSARGPSNYVLNLASGSLHGIDVPGNYGDAGCAGEYLAWSSLTDEPGALARTTVARWTAAR